VSKSAQQLKAQSAEQNATFTRVAIVWDDLNRCLPLASALLVQTFERSKTFANGEDVSAFVTLSAGVFACLGLSTDKLTPQEKQGAPHSVALRTMMVYTMIVCERDV
jgi:hypothetical protein